jgi:hypothetical protein
LISHNFSKLAATAAANANSSGEDKKAMAQKKELDKKKAEQMGGVYVDNSTINDSKSNINDADVLNLIKIYEISYMVFLRLSPNRLNKCRIACKMN